MKKKQNRDLHFQVVIQVTSSSSRLQAGEKPSFLIDLRP